MIEEHDFDILAASEKNTAFYLSNICKGITRAGYSTIGVIFLNRLKSEHYIQIIIVMVQYDFAYGSITRFEYCDYVVVLIIHLSIKLVSSLILRHCRIYV